MDTSPNVQRMRTHTATIACQMFPILSRFAEEFSRACPEARGVFELSTKRQRFDAARDVAEVVKHLDHPEMMRPWLRSTGEHFAKRGLTQAHVSSACEAMMDAVRGFSGENWSVELEYDWRRTLALVFSMMSEGLPAWEESKPMRMAA